MLLRKELESIYARCLQPWIEIMPHPFQVVDRCIYCDSTTPPLTREHVLPSGLGGRKSPRGWHEALILHRASCETCRLILHELETECLAKMMGLFRAKTGLSQSLKGRKTARVRIMAPDGKAYEDHLSLVDIPEILMLPRYSRAGILDNRPIQPVYHIDLWAAARLGRALPTGKGHSIPAAGMGPDRFAQMLAKIALGTAVAILGMDTVAPLVRNFILRKPNEFGYWVGGRAGEPHESPDPSSLHTLRLRWVDGTPFIAVDVRLFASHGGPTNYVIVGCAR
jgi:hypothetical protein